MLSSEPLRRRVCVAGYWTLGHFLVQNTPSPPHLHNSPPTYQLPSTKKNTSTHVIPQRNKITRYKQRLKDNE